MIWLARNNELWESACPALIFLPWHPLQGCQSDGRIKRPTTFFFLSLAPSQCLSFLAVRRAPTDQWGWAESWTTCWQDLLNSPQWCIVQQKEGKAEPPVHSYSSQIYGVCSPLLFFSLRSRWAYDTRAYIIQSFLIAGYSLQSCVLVFWKELDFKISKSWIQLQG